MAPRDGVRCWICGRTQEELKLAIGSAVPEVTEVDRNMAKVADARARFVRDANEWTDGVPEQFKNMDFNFVMGNPTQFRSIKFIDDVQATRKTHLEPLGDAALLARKGKEFAIADFKIDTGDGRRKEIVLKEVDDFERRTGRALQKSHSDEKEEADPGRAQGFDGFKLGEGLKYLREAGTLYYYVQQKLLEVDKEDERKKLPTYEIGMARIKGFPKAVPLCTVCESLIKGL